MKESEIARKVSLRAEQEEDRPFLRKVYGETRAHEQQYTNWTAAQFESFLDQQFAAQHEYYHANYSEALFQVIVMKPSEPIGRFYVQEGPDEFRVIDIALLTGWQRQGIGGYLMREVIDRAREAGKDVSIHVEQNNPAMRLYERLGFSKVEANGVYHLMKWSTSPENESAEEPDAAP